MPEFFAEKGAASAGRSPSLARPGYFVSRREAAREAGKPLATNPNPVYQGFVADFRAFHPEIKTQQEARNRFYAAHRELWKQQHDGKFNQREFAKAMRDLLSGERERQIEAGRQLYGSPNRQDWRYSQQGVAA